jgi:hypothetical protein
MKTSCWQWVEIGVFERQHSGAKPGLGEKAQPFSAGE